MTGLMKRLSPTPFAMLLGLAVVVAWAALWVVVLFELSRTQPRQFRPAPPPTAFSSAAEPTGLG